MTKEANDRRRPPRRARGIAVLSAFALSLGGVAILGTDGHNWGGSAGSAEGHVGTGGHGTDGHDWIGSTAGHHDNTADDDGHTWWIAGADGHDWGDGTDGHGWGDSADGHTWSGSTDGHSWSG